MRNILRSLFIFSLCIFPAPETKAGDLPPFLRLGIEKGLSNNSVRCILQDKQGFIWIGTYDGLNRYDGTQFTIFRNRLGDSTSLPHNYIYVLHEGSAGDLWVGTGQGAATLDQTSKKFSRLYFYPYQSDKLQLNSYSINGIHTDKTGNTFIGTNGTGLLLKNRGQKSASQVPLLNGTSYLSTYDARAITGAGDQVFIFVNNYGICLFDQVRKVIIPLNTSLITGNCMLSDNAGHIWVGSDRGLDKYDIGARAYVSSFREKAGQLTSSQVSSLYFDQNKDLWIGTDGGGINILRAKGQFSYIQQGANRSSLSSDAVVSIIGDNESRIWIGTLKGGCNVIDPFKNRFLTIAVDPQNTNTLPGNFIHAFCEEKETGEILVGTDGGGLSIWNRAKNSFRNYHHQNDYSTLSHNSVTSIIQDREGVFWLATYGGGVNRFNKREGSFKRYACINDSTGNNDKNAFLVYEDRSGTLWATTFGDGKMYRFNRQKDKFEVFSQELNNIIALAEDRHGQLWAGNANDLIRIDRSGKAHQYYDNGKPIRAIFEDKKGNIWVGSEGGGIKLFDSKNNRFTKQYSDIHGLCNNSVLNILEDEMGYLWLSTFNGLSRFDPVKESFESFFQNDGLQSNQFTFNAAAKLSSGELMFGGISGFNLFKPSGILMRNYMPPVLVTDIIVNNKRLADESRFIGRRNNTQILELQIPYSEALLSFRFDALEYSSPEKIIYAYILEGWDRNWNYPGNSRTVNYNNIREGAYLLRIKSTNASGIWNNKETVLKIVVLPPWYRSWWAYLIYLLTLAGIIYVFNSYRVQQIRLKYAIKLAKENADTEREVNEKRLSFFTNISHEIRTPLTLIINPIKDLLEKQEDQNQPELNSIYRNAKRLLGLVDQLLLFRKTETDTGLLSVSRLNLFEVCNDVTAFFVQLAKARNIDLSIDHPGEGYGEVYGDKGKVEMVIYNLVSNALKYTPDKGKVHLWFEETEHDVRLFVSDSGPGIPAEVGLKLFGKFYQVPDKGKHAKLGFGLGMYLAKQLVDQHKGDLSYQSEPRQGTVFKMILLKGTDHFGDGIEIVDHQLPVAPLVQEIAEGQQQILSQESLSSDGLESLVNAKHSILIVDDNPQMRGYLVREFLNDFIVYEASDGEVGVRITKEKMPDVIISDVFMNEKSGLDFCQEVKGSPQLSHIPFILITGSYSPETKKKGIELGADDFITKPFEKDLLVARVRNLIRNQQNLQKYFYNEITHQQNGLKISSEYKEFLDSCIEIVEKHLDDDDFNVMVLASKIGMSHSKLYKLIKSISGQSANSFIRHIRLRKAAEMFINTDYNVNQAAFFVGIKDVKYFREQFTKTFGMKPSDYIKKYRKSLGKTYKVSDSLAKD
jgi:signal transduction histidine kinase/ligand-binding sensor domain-containing protein/DNA-binding response OmpR family regulator